MKKLTLTLVALFVVAASFAQDYKNSIGLRLGNGHYDVIGVAFKTFITAPGALEFDLGFNPDKFSGNRVNNVSFSGSYQHHFPIGNIQGFKWFVGGGLVLSNTFSDYDDYRGFNAGIFPTGGVEYKLKAAPIVFSADVRPTIHVVEGFDRYDGFYANGGISARFTF